MVAAKNKRGILHCWSMVISFYIRPDFAAAHVVAHVIFIYQPRCIKVRRLILQCCINLVVVHKNAFVGMTVRPCFATQYFELCVS